MKVYRFASEQGVTVERLLELPSAHGLRSSSGISALIQNQLRSELNAFAADATHLPRPSPSGAPGPAEERQVTVSPPPSSSEAVPVHQLARQLATYKDDVIDVLRVVSGVAFWTADTRVDPEIAKLVYVEFARRKAPGGPVRRAAAARPRPARSSQQLLPMRVQQIKPPASPGEKALADALRRLPLGLALLGVDIVGDDRTLDVDAIVVLPNLLATVEVKDTLRVGMIEPYLNGPWEVDGQPFQRTDAGPTNQAVQQARVLGSARREHPELRGLRRIPATICVHGRAQFATRPLHQISPDCFSYNVVDAVDALVDCGSRYGSAVTTGHVQALFGWLQLSPTFCFSRAELTTFGFQERAA